MFQLVFAKISLMASITTEVLSGLTVLLPGFVVAWIFYGLTAYKRPSPFEQVIQALVYNILLRPFVLATGALFQFIGKWVAIGAWTVESELATAVFLAFPLGGLFAGIANSDLLHLWLRQHNILLRKVNIGKPRRWIWTWNNAYPSEWYSALSRRHQYLVLHLAGGRRLYGWPDAFPDDPAAGHFVISEAEWLIEEDGKSVGIPLDNVESVLISVTDVERVEFMTVKSIK